MQSPTPQQNSSSNVEHLAGIVELKKEWLATLDGRTRHSHALLDGEQVAQDKAFSNGCRFPGDPKGAPGEIYNCRYTLTAVVEGYGGKRETYSDWLEKRKLATAGIVS